MAHTPGPWFWDEEGGNVYPVRVVAGKVLAWIDQYATSDYEEVKANAKLMAGAPGLLEALKEITEAELGPEILRALQPWLQKAEATIEAAS